MSQTDDAPDWTVSELLAMDEQQARTTLPVAQYERWEKLQELHEQADETRQEWADQSETVQELTVHADPEKLGTRVDVFGNDVLVHIDNEDPEFRAAADRLDEIRNDVPDEDVADIDPDDAQGAGDALVEMLSASIVEWNGHAWADLREDQRADVMADAREQWGIDGLLLAWVEIAGAVSQDREQRVSVIEKFRDPERRGNR